MSVNTSAIIPPMANIVKFFLTEGSNRYIIVFNTRCCGDDEMENTKKVNNQSVGEEIANSITHGIGALCAIAMAVVAIVYAAIKGDAMSVVSASLYGASLIILYLCSTLYHSLTPYKAKRVFQILDHCSIFILILGSYIPICLSLIRGAMGWTLFGINAFCTVLGIVLNSINLNRWHKYCMVLYVVMGWSIISCIDTVAKLVPTPGMILLVTGGLSYTLGIIFFAIKKLKFAHSIWHLFVLAGSILQYFAFLFYALPVR